MITVKPQTSWSSSNGKVFTVIHVIDDAEGNTWVHYRNQEGQEFSCFQESFISRFSVLPDQSH